MKPQKLVSRHIIQPQKCSLQVLLQLSARCHDIGPGAVLWAVETYVSATITAVRCGEFNMHFQQCVERAFYVNFCTIVAMIYHF